jgi:hypothetical protein
MIELLVSRPTQPIGFIIAPSVLARADEVIV